MNKLHLRIFIANVLAHIAAQLQNAQPPHNTSFSLEQVDGPLTAASIPNELDTLVITDDLSLIQELTAGDPAASNPAAGNPAAGTHDLVKIVFVGTEDALVAAFGTSPDAVVDIWSPANPAAQTARRFEGLLQTLKAQFDAWLYPTWLSSLVDSLPDIIWYKERSGLHNYVNAQFCKTVHKTREDVTDKGHCYIWNAPPESEYQCAETDSAVMSGGKTVIADEKVETDKGMRQFRTYKSPVYGRDGTIIGTVGLGHDVTDFTNMGMELQILVNNLPSPVALVDNNWNFISANQRFLKAFSLTEEALKNTDYQAWKDSLQTEEFVRIGEDNLRHQIRDLITNEEDGRHAYQLTEPKIVDYFDNVSGYYGIFRDVTAEREYERSALEFAVTDALTGLSNRRGFYLYLEHHIGQPITLINLDLDNFKHVNDTYGHAKGDEVLKRIAELIGESFPGSIAARQGGDEFACVFKGLIDHDELTSLTKAFQQRIEDEFDALGVGLGCSIGIADTISLPKAIDQFLIVADHNMYQEKARHHARG